jgi:hypothetical protein
MARRTGINIKHQLTPQDYMAIVDRKFHQQSPDPQGDSIYPKPLCDFFGCDALVVLGDPGAGKTTCFEQAASEEPDAVYVKIRDFLSLNTKRWEGKTLYLDGLDEQRSKTKDGTATLDDLRQRLDALDSPRFRLSCRSADWFGSSDLESLKKVVPSESITVVSIEPLSEADIVVIATERVPDPLLFLEEAHRRGIDELLANPQTLDLILTVVETNDWPSSRTELFEKASEILLREENVEHARARQDKSDGKRLLEAAGYLCAVVLCGGLEGIALSTENYNDSFPYVGDLEQDTEVLRIVAQRKLFKGAGPEQRMPLHRTVAEFLAACFLKDRISEDLPIGRVKSILTGFDGGTLTDLRGVYAWLACLSPQFAASLIPVDPLGIILYGDVAPLAPSTKKLILANLHSLAKRHPWFFHSSRDTAAFGALACPELVKDFRDILDDPDESSTVKSCVIEAIQHGIPLPELADDLMSITRDSRYVSYLRRDALIAYLHVSTQDKCKIINLLDEIHTGTLSDNDLSLRGCLLRILYPSSLSPEKLVNYLDVTNVKTAGGGYSYFLNYELVDTTSDDAVFSLIEAVVLSGKHSRDDYSWGRFVGRLVVRALRLYGESIGVDKLYSWLSITCDKDNFSLLREEDKKLIRGWLETHPNRLMEIFEYCIEISPSDILGEIEYRFRIMVHGDINFPGVYRSLLCKAAAEGDQIKAVYYFSKSVYLLFMEDNADKPSLEELYEYANKYPQFMATLNSLLKCEIPDWHIEHINQNRQFNAEKELKSIKDNEILFNMLDDIRTGRALHNLNILANIYNGFCIDTNSDLAPYDRLVDSTTPEIAIAALEGFRAVLHQDDIYTPFDIAKYHLKKKSCFIGQPLLIGMSLISSADPQQILLLPETTLKAAIAFHFVELVDKGPSWLQLLIEQRPVLTAEALLDYWRPQLKAGSEHITGVYELDYKPEMGFIASYVVIPLLTEYPNCPISSLEHMLWAALLYSERTELIELTHKVLEKPGFVRGKQRVLWFSTGFLINPDYFAGKLAKFIGKDKERAYFFLEHVTGSLKTLQIERNFPLDHVKLGMIIDIAASVFPPFKSSQKTDATVTNSESASRTVYTLIDILSGMTEKAAGNILKQLISRQVLTLWRDNLLHALAIQQQNCREAAFRYPTTKQVIETIKGGKPANLPDLKEVVLDHLKTLRDEFRNGPLDGYKDFWNLDSYGRAKEAIPENDCRDRLLGRLKPILLQQSIQAEPEGHFAEDKRSDIKVLFSSMVLPVEIKRHYHKDVWTAPNEQLHKRYSRDPGATGYGIYLVFWFGIDYRKIPKPPSDIKSPSSAAELEEAIRVIIPDELKDKIEIIVFDCSRPNSSKIKNLQNSLGKMVGCY